MTDQQSARTKNGWERFVENLETAFVFPKGRGGRLVRPRSSRKLAGVCLGLAEYLGWEISLLRVLVVVLAVASSGLVILAYAAAWVLIPEGQYALAEGAPSPVGTSPS